MGLQGNYKCFVSTVESIKHINDKNWYFFLDKYNGEYIMIIQNTYYTIYYSKNKRNVY